MAHKPDVFDEMIAFALAKPLPQTTDHVWQLRIEIRQRFGGTTG